MAIVITCPGAYSTYNTDNFGGTLFALPNTRIPGSWNNFSIDNWAAEIDVDNMYELIVDNIDLTDWLVVAAHSRGAQIVYKLFRQKMTELDTNVNPAKILFISSGNPERKYTGACYTNYAEYPARYPGGDYGVGFGLPPGGSGAFRLLDIVRTYDPWADTPADWTNEDALDAIESSGVHSEYYDAPPLDASGWPVDWNHWTRYDEGNVSYLTEKPALIISPPAKTPLAVCHRGKPLGNWKTETERLDNLARQNIESAYDRPVPLVGYVAD
ncbi:PE-PPE domain-containing protein [Mycolicibacterium austroafricanum]|uniref:PE-PPE domain-containing protein n=1 Tax=Mycolicibacterium austroafricanum TaxID=39687 RepID=UPI000CF8CB8C|nr:PE-PPE domain-containing protein [Mycolicibacterium austroafricanum]PQP41723.1 hypothetical protein C6A88_27915 [Mycolicibacterium austroafricanum]